MVKAHKLHKLLGLTSGLVVLILSITGFFLDHERWSFLYTTTLQHYPSSLDQADKRLFTSYFVDPKHPHHILVGSRRGLYESWDDGASFVQRSPRFVSAIVADGCHGVYIATTQGIYTLFKGGRLLPFMLEGQDVTALSSHGTTLVAVVDKEQIYTIDTTTKQMQRSFFHAQESELKEAITLSRFVRDLHYGRGLFDGALSLYINDFGAIALVVLGLSGWIIWYLIHRKKRGSLARKWIRLHANMIMITAGIPIVLLSLSGIFLDHAQGLRNFMKSVTIPHMLLPPVYDTLHSDIWSVDYDGKRIRIGNRFGVYGLQQDKQWHLESRGFAYSMHRRGADLYIGGMGSANRVLRSGHYAILEGAPHMFKEPVLYHGREYFLSSHTKELPLPKLEDLTLYSLLLGLHDGSFFASWWIWINDYAAVALLLLVMTGIIRYQSKKKARFSSHSRN